MSPRRRDDRMAAWLAAGMAMLMIAQHIAGKATRDAFFLSIHGIDALPTLFIVSAIASVAIVPPMARLLTRLGPARVVPPAFALSAALLVGVWALARLAPSAAAIALYLHVAAVNGILISWFWSMVSERFDPRTARHEMRRMVGGAALGGLIGGLIAERSAVHLGVSRMLLVLAAIHLLCAVVGVPLRRGAPRNHPTGQAPRGAGFGVIARSPYARDLAALVVISTVAATLLDFVFKSGAAATHARGPELLRFFALFYTASGLATFLVQTLLGKVALARLGIAATVATLPLSVVAGSLAALFLPGVTTTALLRGGEATLHSSLFRSGYELFFTPLPPAEKRSVKTLIDVGCDRLGDALGGAALAIALPLLGGWTRSGLLAGAAALSLVVVWLTVRLHRGYVRSLERSLRERAAWLELGDVHDSTTRSVLLSVGELAPLARGTASRPPPSDEPPSDPLLARAAALHSGELDRVRLALAQGPLPPALVPHALPLLGWDEAAPDALAALRQVVDTALPTLIAALTSPDEEFTVRRRLPRVLEAATDPAVVAGLLAGLDDARFEVRYRCGRALVRVQRTLGGQRIDREPIHAAVLKEARLGRGIWEGQRLLDEDDGASGEEDFVDELVRERASRSLEHVFTLLSLASPRKPLVIAFRGLHTDDDTLRGTALEYLEGVLPPEIRAALWPYLEDRRPAQRSPLSRDEALQALLVSNKSIQLNLQRRRGG